MSSADAGTMTPAMGETLPNTGTETIEERSNSNSQGTSGARSRGPSNSGNTFRISNFKGEFSKV